MEQYRKRIKKRLIGFCTAGVFALIFVAAGYIYYQIGGSQGHIKDFIIGVQCGVFLGGAIAAGLQIYYCIRALKSEEACRKMYIEEHDERAQAVKNRASFWGYWILVMVLFVAIIVAGFFNTIVFITLLAVLMFVCLLTLFLKCIFEKTM